MGTVGKTQWARNHAADVQIVSHQMRCVIGNAQATAAEKTQVRYVSIYV